jgi:hypothetical protein
MNGSRNFLELCLDLVNFENVTRNSCSYHIKGGKVFFFLRKKKLHKMSFSLIKRIILRLGEKYKKAHLTNYCFLLYSYNTHILLKTKIKINKMKN